MKLRKFKVVIPIEVETWALSEEDARGIGDSLSFQNMENLLSCRGTSYISYRDEGQLLSIEPRKSYYDIRFPQAEDE